MFHKEGKSWITTTFLAWLLILVGSYFITDKSWLQFLLIFLATSFLIIILQFFRNPKRLVAQKDDNLIYAPADGKVVVIEKTKETEYYKEDRIQVSIFMSPTNVHVNRYPFSGLVEYYKHHKGKYLVAWHPKSSTENERSTVVLTTKDKQNSILMRQIAGFLAKRIVTYSREGDSATQGEDFGFIKFGSRVDIFLPLDAKINVSINDVVKGNGTIIAQFK